MLGFGLVSECEKLIAFLKTSRQSRGTYLSEVIARAESDIALSKGEVPNPQAIACSAGEENGKSVILWEIRSAGANSPSRAQQAGFSGINLSKLDGRWDLELQALSGLNAVRRLAMISKVKSRGKWVGKLPEGTFRIQAVLHSPSSKKDVASSSYSGQWIPIANVPNLAVNPGFDGVANAANPAADHASSGPIKGWEHLPDASLKPGGPRTGGLSAVLKFDGNRKNPPLLGERIPMEKGKEYLQTGWLKLWSGDDANYGVRFLDQDGKEVGSETCGHSSGYLAGWTFLSQTLSAAGSKGEHDIPEKAAFLQPFLEGRGTISLQHLFLGDVTLPKTESKPDALPAPQALAGPAGMENGKFVVVWDIRPADEDFTRASSDFALSARSEEKFDGRYDVELLHLSPPNAVRRLALLPKAKARGKWVGKLPDGSGFILARLHPATGKTTPSDLFYAGPAISVVNVPNLITNAGFEGFPEAATPAAPGADPAPPVLAAPAVKGWGWPPDAGLQKIEIKPGGPCPQGTQIVFSLSGNTPVLLVGEKIPVQTDKNYTLSGWGFFQNAKASRLGVQYLDKNGKDIGTAWNKRDFKGGKWSLSSSTVTTAKKSSEAGRRAPDMAVSLRPVIEIRGGFALDALFLGETAAQP